MAGLGAGTLNGCSYDIHAAAFDGANNTAVFFAIFTGSHVGEGGPVPAMNNETNSHYVYALKLNDDNRISHMTKIWNAPWPPESWVGFSWIDRNTMTRSLLAPLSDIR